MTEAVRVRHFKPESDAHAVHDIWIDGLRQTSDEKWWLYRPFWRFMFYMYARKAVQENGDVGPEGENIFRHWCEDKDNRCMLVAEKEESGNNMILGCMAVIRGKNPALGVEVTNEETTFSVWKMSVAEESRGRGVGRKLLEAGERWAKENGCVKMVMVTANPVASRFYMKNGYEPSEPTKHASWYEKKI